MNAGWMGWEFARRGYTTQRLPSVQKALSLRTALFWVITQRVVARLATRCVITQDSAVLTYFAAEA
jgi:hypothetical protein